jgi:hypothetical protein
MAGSLKLKIAITGFSVVLFALIEFLDNRFFAPATIKRWSKISWEDFQGIPQPFTEYEAGISSSIYLEYDSALSRYRAYAGQNNMRSWARRSHEDQDYELNHEQYHFNITELHARMLNTYIDENPKGSQYLFRLRLGSINIDLRRMQDRYDTESDHSLNYDKQRRWEFKIDSLLSLKNGWVRDQVSNARIFYPVLPDSIFGIDQNQVSYRSRSLAKYAMQFGLVSYRIPDVAPHALREHLYTYDPTYGRAVKFVEVDTTHFDFQGFVISADTSGTTLYTKWVYNDPYLYKIYSSYPNTTIDSTGYYQNAKSFLDSFSLDSIE